jgi:hypothetical protein
MFKILRSIRAASFDGFQIVKSKEAKKFKK